MSPIPEKVMLLHAFLVVSLLAAATVFACASLAGSVRSTNHHGPRAPLQPLSGVTRALLIGVSHYPNLGPQQQLEGPPNDVALVRRMLMDEPFNVSSERITVLVEPTRWRSEDPRAPARPTRANIAQAFRHLAEEAGPGDQVVVMFAGHGSQQPENGPGGDEDDGLDEILLPSDVGRWDGGVRAVERAIVDDELGSWLTSIRAKGAFVWALIDACQSTSATRGSTETARTVAPTTLGIPAQLTSRLSRTRGQPAESSMIGHMGTAGDIAALYAAQTIEPTPEKRLPEGSKQAQVHGLFTYTLVRTIQQAAGRLTYRDVAERVIRHYRALGRMAPTPGFEGGGLDRAVLGTASFSGSARLRLGPTVQGRTTLRAGAVHGLVNGAMLAIYPPEGSLGRDARLGHVVVSEDPGANTAVVAPISYDGMAAPSPEQLVENARGEIVVFGPALTALRVAHQPAPGSSSAIEQAVGAAARQLGTATKGLAVFVERATDADWVVRVGQDGQVTLAPSSGWRAHDDLGQERQAPVVLAKRDGDIARPLSASVSAIARVSNLLKLAANQLSGGDVAIELEVLRYSAQQAEPTRLATDAVAVVRLGDVLAFRLRNTGVVAVDVSVLFIDANYGVGVVFPLRDQEATASLVPDGTLTTTRMRVTPPTGWEAVLVIASPRSGSRPDLRMLEQPPLGRLPEAYAAQLDVTRTLGTTPLDTLVRLVTQNTARGQRVADARAYAIRMLTWKTEPAVGPQNGPAAPP
jgi:hypothetical protein